ncbi:hypothetical protein F0562_011519 [Nyssa sinensis]|uniref:ELM2 domain-containing protein n=1 Tax=Nyssa sinensis TaxID=561372 RepID=A0A5J4ZSR7_9ASTE|nr:hypothetical protein F0562_011519 [Nyssa sinensis]
MGPILYRQRTTTLFIIFKTPKIPTFNWSSPTGTPICLHSPFKKKHLLALQANHIYREKEKEKSKLIAGWSIQKNGSVHTMMTLFKLIRAVGSVSISNQAKFRVLLSNGQQLKNKDSEIIESESNKNSECIDLDNDKSEVVNLLAAGNTNKVHENAERIINDDDEKVCVNNDNNVVGSDTSIANEALNSGKRKRESLFSLGMLNCVRQVAKHSDDPAIRTIPECSKWKKRESEEIWPKVLLAQEALLIRKHVDSHTEESRLQKQLKRHASIFEDNDVLNHKSTEGLRCSERFPSLTKSHLSRSCNSCSVTQSKLVSPRKAEVENSPKEQALLTVDILATNTTDGMSEDEALQKHVPVGPLFQAEVPKWTGVVSKSDSKWLGIQIWPQEDVKHNSFIEMDPIGKGRQDSCGCRLPGSVDCVRFHIAEKRMKLKLELGSVFYRWRFDRMGEEVSLSWTIDEEKKFKNMVRSKPPSLNKCFWDNVFKFFPTKTREKLVSYYFNVFLIRQRSYQNRVTPKNIDSDDEESEFGCVGDGFGYEAVKIPGSKLLCVLNEQYTELA